VINPTWLINTGSQDEISFLSGTANAVNEKYSLDITTAQSDASPISQSLVYLYVGSGSYDLQTSGSTNTSGEFSDNILYRTYTDGTTVLDTLEYKNFALKVYKYGFVPFVSAITENEALESTVTLVNDTDLSADTSASAMSLGGAVQVTQSVANPNELIDYDGGTVDFTDNEIVTFGGGGTGIFRERSEGNTAAGKIFVVGRNATAIGDGESITGDVSGVATTNGTGVAFT